MEHQIDNGATGQVSPDGQWMWNGTDWVPTGTTPSPVAPRRRSRRGIKIVGGIVAAFLVLGVAGALTGGPTDSGDAGNTASAPGDEKGPKDSTADDPATDKDDTGEDAADGTRTDEGSADDEAAAGQPEDTTAGIGDKVADGKFTFVVTGVKRGVSTVGESFLAEEAQGAYTLVTMKIENTGDQPQTFFSDNIEGIDSKGRKISADSGASFAASEDSDAWMEEINPGNSITVTVAFDLAKGVRLETIRVHDSMFSGGADISLA